MSAKAPGRRTFGGGPTSSEGSFMPWDPETFASSLKEKMNDIKEAISSKSKFTAMIATDLGTFLTQPVIATDLAASEKALATFRTAVEYIQLVATEVPAFSLPAHFDRVQSFATHCQKLANNIEKEKADKEKATRKRRAKPKSPATIDDSDGSDAEIVIEPNGDTKMSDNKVEGIQSSIHATPDIEIVPGPKKGVTTRATTVSIPYSAIPGICTQSNAYLKAAFYLAKARGKLPAFKKVRIEPAFSNVQAETAVLSSSAEALDRITEGQQVDRFASLVPFLNLETLEAPTYLSIANFLKSELNTLAHATKYYSGQYAFVQQQLEEVNRIHMSKMDLNGAEQAGNTASEATAGPSNASAA
ncbi:hypothetical protein PQX77_019583 [Marasmius sp. AFHP31]|nr:hypothetical protein PQX77_019583 [Marasmius sp. AFHP31]